MEGPRVISSGGFSCVYDSSPRTTPDHLQNFVRMQRVARSGGIKVPERRTRLLKCLTGVGQRRARICSNGWVMGERSQRLYKLRTCGPFLQLLYTKLNY